MTLWLANLAAYSVQLAALVAAGAAVVAVLRLDAPRAALRFWQALFVLSLAWPVLQVRMITESSGSLASAFLSEVFPGGELWSAGVSSSGGMRAGIAALDADVATLVIALLAVGAALRVGWLVVGLLRLRYIRATSEPAFAIESVASTLQRELGVSADIRFSDAVDGPATIGAQHPTVLLPRRVSRLPIALQRAVVCHELLHVRRRDWLQGVLEELCCAVLWFHPGARVLASRLNLARETVVDAATIAHTRDRRAYAAALLEFSNAARHPAGATALIGCRHLERRITLIAQEVSMTGSSLAFRLATAAVAVACVTLATTSTFPISATVQAQSQKVYKSRGDSSIVLPRIRREVKPTYTSAAMRARIQGAVWMAVVVQESGDVGEVTVTQSLDQEHGLDQQAVEAVRQWKFTPGTRAGKPVPVEVEILMTFTLK